jgi:hypothetical protein
MLEQHLPIHEVFERNTLAKVGTTRLRRSFAHAILLSSDEHTLCRCRALQAHLPASARATRIALPHSAGQREWLAASPMDGVSDSGGRDSPK